MTQEDSKIQDFLGPHFGVVAEVGRAPHRFARSPQICRCKHDQYIFGLVFTGQMVLSIVMGLLR